jgi:hypothetical protein
MRKLVVILFLSTNSLLRFVLVLLTSFPLYHQPLAIPLPFITSKANDEKQLITEWQKRMARLPTVTYRLHRIIVYRNAVIMHVTFHNHTAEPIRLSLIREPLTFRGIPFKDRKQGVEWLIPPLINQYHFLDDTMKNSVVVESGMAIDLQLVDALEKPVLVPKQVQQQKKLERPIELECEIDFTTSLPRKDLAKPLILVHAIGKGTIQITWKDEKNLSASRPRSNHPYQQVDLHRRKKNLEK